MSHCKKQTFLFNAIRILIRPGKTQKCYIPTSIQLNQNYNTHKHKFLKSMQEA